MLRPNASRILSSWGLAPDFDAICDTSSTTAFYNLVSGEAGERRQAVDVSRWPDWGLSRGQAWSVLYRAVQRVGGSVRWGARIEELSVVSGGRGVGEGVRIKLKGGETRVFDLVFDASGAHSSLREGILNGTAMKATQRTASSSAATTQYSPHIEQGTAYSLSVPANLVAANAEARTLLESTALKVWMGGRDRYVVQRYHEKSQEIYILCFVTVDETPDMRGFWDEDGDIAHLRTLFADCAPSLVACMHMTDSCSRWKFNEMPDLDSWVGESGRIALLGDSAHSMLPNAAQGFSQIVEDIGVLDYLLHDERLVADGVRVEELMRLWESTRIPRVNMVKAFARWNTAAFTGQAPPGAWTRHNTQKNKSGDSAEEKEKEKKVTTVEVSLRDIRPDKTSRYSSAKFLKWVMDYDAVGEARSFVSRGEKQSKPHL